MNLLFVEIEFRQARETAESEIMFKFHLHGSRFREGVKVQKFLERKRQHPDFDITPGQISCQIGREQIGVGTGDIDVGIQFHLKRIDRLFPVFHPLNLIEKQIKLLRTALRLLHYQVVKLPIADPVVLERFEVDPEYPIFRNVLFFQMFNKELKQTRFATTPDTGHDLDDVLIPIFFQFLQI
ncbi:hypothetical protein SDC9_138395 [bioreactor metagenome]|uniref:Uncharacterized protein n=1 Tax=bioreactor metagenome TaxID=1076179 RepID=A0A645DPL7_9ZZZZ